LTAARKRRILAITTIITAVVAVTQRHAEYALMMIFFRRQPSLSRVAMSATDIPTSIK
jgi:hypothetical protein